MKIIQQAVIFSAISCFFPVVAVAQPLGQPAQLYSNGTKANEWTYYPQNDCFAIWWSYWDTKLKRYKKHVVYYFRSDPNNYYFYDLDRDEVWGRCTNSNSYSRLPLKYRKPKVSEIDPSWFPEPDEMPIMPNSNGLQMDPPPPVPVKP